MPRSSPAESNLQAFAPRRYPTTPGFCMHSTRFWAAREPEFLRYQQRQMDFIKEELNVNPR